MCIDSHLQQQMAHFLAKHKQVVHGGIQIRGGRPLGFGRQLPPPNCLLAGGPLGRGGGVVGVLGPAESPPPPPGIQIAAKSPMLTTRGRCLVGWHTHPLPWRGPSPQ